MDVLLIEKREIKLPSGAVVTYPAGWSGPVPEEHGRAWVVSGAAHSLDAETPAQLSEDQTRVLGALADELLHGAAPGAGAAAGDDNRTFALEDLTIDELKAVAKELGVGLGKKPNREQAIATLAAYAAAQANAPEVGPDAASTGNAAEPQS